MGAIAAVCPNYQGSAAATEYQMASAKTSPVTGPIVYALACRHGDDDWLARGCAARGLALRSRSSLAAIASAVASGAADYLILCTSALPPGSGLADALDYLRRTSRKPYRVLCFSDVDALPLRLAARRAGCVGFHLLPIDDAALDDALSTLVPQAAAGSPAPRILVVDDVTL
jgi:hypothetical protein